MSVYQPESPRSSSDRITTSLTGPFIDAAETAEILGKSKSTLLSDRNRAPSRVPPCYRIPGSRRLLWDRQEVIDWVRRFPEPRNEFLHEGWSPPALCHNASHARVRRQGGGPLRGTQSHSTVGHLGRAV